MRPAPGYRAGRLSFVLTFGRPPVTGSSAGNRAAPDSLAQAADDTQDQRVMRSTALRRRCHVARIRGLYVFHGTRARRQARPRTGTIGRGASLALERHLYDAPRVDHIKKRTGQLTGVNDRGEVVQVTHGRFATGEVASW